jgi:hypothetical protein
MNSHVAGHGAAEHRRAQRLLPWLLAGTLEGTELGLVQAHLQRCGACQADLAWQRRLRAAAPPPDGRPDPDRALAQLLPRLGPQPARASLPERLRNAIAANDAAWLRWTAAAQLAAIAVLGLMLARGDGDPAYRALGAPAQAEGKLVVMFRPDTPEHELRRIVQSSGARLADGPTVTDAYVLALPAAAAPVALARLRAEPAVTLAQPLQRPERP